MLLNTSMFAFKDMEHLNQYYDQVFPCIGWKSFSSVKCTAKDVTPAYVGIYMQANNILQTWKSILKLKENNSIVRMAYLGMPFVLVEFDPSRLFGNARSWFCTPTDRMIIENRLQDTQRRIWQKGFSICKFCEHLQNRLRMQCSLDHNGKCTVSLVEGK